MRRHAQPRRGYALVLLVLFMMVFLSIAGLVIGLGFARLSQQQMRSATDAAALEGLRWRDEIPQEVADTVQGCGPADVENEMWRDCARRYLAAEMTERVLSDPSGQSTTLGAGPLLVFEDGIPLGDDFQASETISLPDQRSYVPQLRLNLNDQPHGDMVAGSYGTNLGFPAGSAQDETSDYQRRDFVVDGGNDAFLVRMRRTRGGDLDEDAGVSSRGPEVPMLFGRWMTFQSGVTVRSTSIARNDTVKAVGKADAALEMNGLATFALDVGFWNETSNWSSQDDVSTAQVSISNDNIEFSGNVVGKLIANSTTPLTIGATITPSSSETPGGQFDVYAPIVDDVNAPSPVVIGFGYVVFNTTSGELERPLRDGALSSYVAAENVTASIPNSLPAPYASDSGALEDLLNTNASISFPLTTPVLVNRHLGPSN